MNTIPKCRKGTHHSADIAHTRAARPSARGHARRGGTTMAVAIVAAFVTVVVVLVVLKKFNPANGDRREGSPPQQPKAGIASRVSKKLSEIDDGPAQRNGSTRDESTRDETSTQPSGAGANSPPRESDSAPSDPPNGKTQTVEAWADETEYLPRRKFIGTLVDGEPQGDFRGVDEQGRLIMVEHYEHGVQQGERTDYYPSGNRFAVYRYKDGIPHGTNQRWFDNGKLAYQAEFVDGRLHGKVITYFPNGNKHTESEFVDGVDQGIILHFLPRGRVFARSRWVNGQQVERNVVAEVTPADLNAIRDVDRYSSVLKDHWNAAPTQPVAPAPTAPAQAERGEPPAPVKPSEPEPVGGKDRQREFAGKRYKVFTDVESWHAAKEKCEKLGGRLAIVSSTEENDYLTQLVLEAGLREAWLGATDEAIEGQWVWVDGTPMHYKNWKRTQPNNKGGVENYLLLWAVQKGVWSDQPDVSTQHKPGVICQWDRSNDQKEDRVDDRAGAPANATGEGWVQLFNGRDLAGWKQNPDPHGKTHWEVAGGVLTGTGQGHMGYLYTERGDFGDFHLRLEAKVNAQGNSGVFFRVPSAGEFAKATPGGLEAQISVSDKTKTGGMYGRPQANTNKQVHQSDEWFVLEVFAKGTRIVVKVNGQTTADFETSSGPDASLTKGHIALQKHFSAPTVIEFRKIEVKPL